MSEQTAAPMRAVGAIDVHAHFADASAVQAMAAEFPAQSPNMRAGEEGWLMDIPAGWFPRFPDGVTRSIPSGLVDPKVRLAEMDRQGVDCQAISGYTFLNFYAVEGSVGGALHRINNDAMIALAESHPGRFIALPGLPMQDAEAACDEIRRLAAHELVAGVGIGTNIDGADLDDPRFEQVWEALNSAELPVLVHPPGIVAGAERLKGFHLNNLVGNPTETTVCAARIIFSGILDRFPSLRFCFVHGGGFVPYQIGRWDHGWRVRDEARERIGAPPSTYIPGRLFFDSLTHDERALRALGSRFGWRQVVAGSDYPWDMATDEPIEGLRLAGLTDDELRVVATDSAIRFLRWPHTWPPEG